MYNPKDTDKFIVLKGKYFRVYKLDDFLFDQSLNITDEKGVYCFTKTENAQLIVKKKASFKVNHRLFYLGKADGKYGINERLTSEHDKFDEMKRRKVNRVCIYVCKDYEYARNIEKELLSEYGFALNELENDDKETSIVEEVLADNQP